MGILGGLLIFLALPLLIGYSISEKKNHTWLRLGLIMGAVGLLIVLLGSAVR
jgi:hypothetical protein